MAAEDCNIDTRANALFTSLTSDLTAAPTLDVSATFTADATLAATPSGITLADLTDGSIDGEGVFDKLMASVDEHIKREFQGGRITGDQYAKVYTQISTQVLNNATQFVLGKDQAKWNAIAAQMQARVAEIQATAALLELEKVRMEAVRVSYEMQNAGALYGLTKVQTANAEMEHCLLEAQTEKEQYTNTNILPVMFAQERHKLNCLMPAQTLFVQEQYEAERAKTMTLRSDGITPVDGLIGSQQAGLAVDVESKQFSLDSILPGQLNLLLAQYDSERAKTQDTLADGTTEVLGSIGKQKDLYTQQIDSFDKDAKHKTAKMYLDGWITQKTLDEGLTAPNELTNNYINTVLESVRNANGL